MFADLKKNFLGRIIFRPNIQALEKNVAKMAISVLPHLLWPKMAKIVQKLFLVDILDLLCIENFFETKHKGQNFAPNSIFLEISLLPHMLWPTMAGNRHNNFR